MAAYTFEARPPFALTSVSSPFVLAGRATPYPIGLVATRRHLLLSYGADDSEWCAHRHTRAPSAPAAPSHTATPPRRALWSSSFAWALPSVRRYVARLNRSALVRALRPVATEDAPLATPDAHTSLPWRFHFFAGMPKRERERLTACAQTPGAASDPACKYLFSDT